MRMITKEELGRILESASMRSRLGENLVNLRFINGDHVTAISFYDGVPFSYRDFSMIASLTLSTDAVSPSHFIKDAEEIVDLVHPKMKISQYLLEVKEATVSMSSEAKGGLENLRRILSGFNQVIEYEVEDGLLSDGLHWTRLFAR